MTTSHSIECPICNGVTVNWVATTPVYPQAPNRHQVNPTGRTAIHRGSLRFLRLPLLHLLRLPSTLRLRAVQERSHPGQAAALRRGSQRAGASMPGIVPGIKFRPEAAQSPDVTGRSVRAGTSRQGWDCVVNSEFAAQAALVMAALGLRGIHGLLIRRQHRDRGDMVALQTSRAESVEERNG